MVAAAWVSPVSLCLDIRLSCAVAWAWALLRFNPSRSRNLRSRNSSSLVIFPSAVAHLSALLQPSSSARATVLASPYERLAISDRETWREFGLNSWDLAAVSGEPDHLVPSGLEGPAAVGMFAADNAGPLVTEGAGTGANSSQGLRYTWHYSTYLLDVCRMIPLAHFKGQPPCSSMTWSTWRMSLFVSISAAQIFL